MYFRGWFGSLKSFFFLLEMIFLVVKSTNFVIVLHMYPWTLFITGSVKVFLTINLEVIKF